MKNPVTFKVESYMGIFFVTALGIFFMGFFVLATRSFQADVDAISFGNAKIRVISRTEENLINEWLSKNEIDIPDSKIYYRYILKNNPDRPWLK